MHSVAPAGKSISLRMLQALLGETTACPSQTGRCGWTGDGGLGKIPALDQSGRESGLVVPSPGARAAPWQWEHQCALGWADTTYWCSSVCL